MNETLARSNRIIEALTEYFGDDDLVSDWLEVKQEYMDRFAEATLDPDWMHIDPKRAKEDGPFGGTVAFGFWTMSMLTYFTRRTAGREYPPGIKYGLNYGFDKVRLMAPVPVGSRIRNRSRLIDIEDKRDGRFIVRTENRIEIEGSQKPAMVAEWLHMLFVDPGDD